jgi:gag-polypeptide of LTR copia-type
MKEYYLGRPEDIPKATQATFTADEAKVMEQNENAYADLIMSMDTSTQSGKIEFALVRGSKNRDYPDGNAAASWRRLKAKYMPETAPTVTGLHQEFYSSKLQQGYDPNIWMTKLEFIQLQLEELDYTITNEQFMVHIINNLTQDYET